MIKKKKVIFLSVFLLLFLTIGGLAVAESVTLTESGTLLIDNYHLDRFNSYLSSHKGLWGVFKGEGFQNAISGFVNILFEFIKIIYQVFDKAIELMYSLNVIDKLNDIVSQLTNNLWLTFKGNYASIVIIIAMLIVARTFFFESSKQALQQLGKVVLVLIVAGIWFPRANDYLTKMNNYSFLFQADIMQSASQVSGTSGMVGGGTWTTDADGKPIKQIDENKASEIATNTIRNELFTQTIYRPFLLLNYGTADTNKIDDMYQNVDDEDIPKNTGGEYLLSDEFAKLDSKKKEDMIDKLAGKEDDPSNEFLTIDKVGYKFVISLVYLVGVFLYGIPLVAIAFLNVLLQLLAIIYSYILPIIALLSLFPKYSNGLINSIITIGKIFMGKAFLGLLVLLFSMVNVALDLLIPQNTMVTALLNLFIKGVVYFLAIKYRQQLANTVVRALTGHAIHLPKNNNRDRNERNIEKQSLAFETGAYQPNLSVDSGQTPVAQDYHAPEEYNQELEMANGQNIQDPQTSSEPNSTIQVDTPDHIVIEDVQVDTPDHIDVDDVRTDMPDHIDVDDVRVDIPDKLDVKEPIEVTQSVVEKEQGNGQATQNLHLHQHQGDQHINQENGVDINQSQTITNQNTYNEEFHSRLEEMRG